MDPDANLREQRGLTREMLRIWDSAHPEHRSTGDRRAGTRGVHCVPARRAVAGPRRVAEGRGIPASPVATEEGIMTSRRWRRRYRLGRCQDCGHYTRVTVVRFWVNYMRYVVCASCIRSYRRVILTHTKDEHP